MTRSVVVRGPASHPPASAVVELLKPITWFPPMWAFGCGVASAPVGTDLRWTTVAAGIVLCGPMVCGTSQVVNDWFDRHVDAINEPRRPIPSGRVPGRWGLYIAIGWTLLSLLLAALLGTFAFLATVVGLVLAWAYSAPPVRLKRNGWWGNSAVALCYEGLPWLTAAAIMTGTIPGVPVVLLALLYSVGCHGIMTLNDFKSIDGDLRMGIGSLPARLGAARAARVACWVMAVPQVAVIALLFHWDRRFHALSIVVLLAVQLILMQRLLKRPRELAPWYNATGISLYVTGMLVSAFAVRGSAPAMKRSSIVPGLGWLAIFRMGLVQTALGAIVVLTTSTMNRVMVVELALPAMLPGALVALHYAIQMLRPRMGHGSDVGGWRTPWIVGGMAVLALGGLLASIATAWMATSTSAGVMLAILAFVLIGGGVGAAGTSLLVLVAKSVDASRRAPAATIMWTMMIAGFAVTAGVVGANLDPYTPARLVTVTAIVSSVAFVLALAAVWGVERRHPPQQAQQDATRNVPGAFRAALGEVWREPQARCFTLFVFVSMLAFSAQDLILEPFAGIVFGMTPGESTRLSGLQNGGVLVGMLLVAFVGGSARGRRVLPLRTLTIAGCVASAAALASIAWAGGTGSATALRTCVAALGLANGIFAASAVASMMELAHSGHARREGVRIGLWGAAQAVAYALGGFLGAAGVDMARALVVAPLRAYATVFVVEALLFLVAAWFASRVGSARKPAVSPQFDGAAIRGAGQSA